MKTNIYLNFAAFLADFQTSCKLSSKSFYKTSPEYTLSLSEKTDSLQPHGKPLEVFCIFLQDF